MESLIAYWLFHEAVLIELFKTDAQIILNITKMVDDPLYIILQ